MNPEQISISRGNSKIGCIPSVSLPPVTTCPRAVPCIKDCYALSLCNFRPTVRAAYERNLHIYTVNPGSFWLQVRAVAAVNAFFRYHVAGDIPDVAYLVEMVNTAQSIPTCRFLCYTKRYDWVNKMLDFMGKPDNLVIVFSGWGPDWVFPNPHNLPVFDVLQQGALPDPRAFLCPGNCTNCITNRVGCYFAKPGDLIQCYQHDHGRDTKRRKALKKGGDNK